MGYEESLFDDDEVDSSNVMQVHVQAASVQSREYLCAVSTAAEAESWVVALRWAAERRRMNKEQKRINEKFNSLGIAADDKLIIMGSSDEKEANDVGEYGRDSKESLTSTGTDDSWCKADKRLSDKDERTTTNNVPNETLEASTKQFSASIQSFDDLGGDQDKSNDSTLMPTPKAKNLLDSLLVEEKSKTTLPSKLFEEKEHTTNSIDEGATIVITKVCKFQLQLDAAMSLSVPIPLPGQPLAIKYEIHLLLLKDCETINSSLDANKDLAMNSKILQPKSIQEQTILKSAQDILGLIHCLKSEFGDNEISEIDTLEFLDEVESSLLSDFDMRKSTSNKRVSTVISDIISTNKALYETVEVVNRVIRSLSTHGTICSSKQFQQFLHLNASTEDDVKVTQRQDLIGESVDHIVKAWLCIKGGHQLSNSIQIYLAVTLHHPFGGPALILIVLWLALRSIGMAWYIIAHSFPVISIPLETYTILIAAAFYYGNDVGMRSSQSDVLGIARNRSSRHIHGHIHDNTSSSLPDELVDDDDHSTLVDELNLDSDEGLTLPETESVHEPPVLSSPLPKFPENNGASCWSKPDHNIFMVRSRSYLSDRMKTPSAPSMFECRGVDIWLTDNAERNISRHPSMLGGKLHKEDTFIVNFLLPFANLVAYFSVKPVEQMPRNVARVWQAFVKGDQEYRDAKLKLLPVVVDGPWIVKKAVGPGTSPAMLGKDLPLQYFFTEPTETKKGVYEVDVLVTASRLARGILNVVKSHTQSLTIAFAFIIEASEQIDLPEQVLCSFQVHSLHLEDCPCLPEHALGDPCD
jgi:hypothetical protein